MLKKGLNFEQNLSLMICTKPLQAHWRISSKTNEINNNSPSGRSSKCEIKGYKLKSCSKLQMKELETGYT